MAIRLWKIRNITRAVIECRRSRSSGEERRTALTLDEKRPLVASGMPVNLAHAAWVYGDNCGREVAGDGESERIDNFDRATGDFMSGLLGEVVGITLSARNETSSCGDILFLNVLRGRCTFENIELIVRNVVKS